MPPRAEGRRGRQGRADARRLAGGAGALYNYNEKDSIYINNEKMYIEKIEIQKKENKSLDNKNIILKAVVAVETVLLISLLLLK